MKANNQLACIIFFFTFQLVISVSHINIESPPPLLPQPKKKLKAFLAVPKPFTLMKLTIFNLH